MRGRFLTSLTPWLLGATLGLACGLAGCSGQQQDDDDLQGDNNNNGNANGDLGNDDAHEGNGQENFVDGDESKGSKDSADVNSSTGADTAGSESLNATLDPGGAAGGGTPGGDAPPANGGAGGNAAAAAAAPAAGATTAAATAPGAGGGKAAAPAGDGAPVPGGRVRYVKEGGIQVVNAPNGSPVMTLEQGEHPLTWEENGWLKIANGLYVPVDSLSALGVPRPQNPHRWDGGSGGGSGGGSTGDAGGDTTAGN